MVMVRCSVQHVACVVGELDHAVVILGREVHEVEIARIDGRAFVVNFVVEMGAGGLAGVADQGDDIASLDLLSLADERLEQVRVVGLVVETVVDDDHVAEALSPAGEGDRAVAGSIDVGARGRGEVHAFMEAAGVVDRVHTPAVA